MTNRERPDNRCEEARNPLADGALGLCVLASGSGGNCSVLVSPSSTEPGAPRRITLIDAGLSPRRTAALLAERGIRAHEVDDIVLTHLDTDHAHTGWAAALRRTGWRATLRVHRRHLGRAERMGLLAAKTYPFEDAFELGGRVRASVVMAAHDSLGVASFRFEATRAGDPGVTSLGFATDLGRVTDTLVTHMAGVDVLAIESNYCPRMQADSDRPAFLKRRIMGGAGHLSNQESADAARRIAPRSSTVLLHLSRQCNTPGLALGAHESGGYSVVVSDQHRPTGWVWAKPSTTPARAPLAPMPSQGVFAFAAR